jgi:hypothetical protein
MPLTPKFPGGTVEATWDTKAMKVKYTVDPPDAKWIFVSTELFRKMSDGLGWVEQIRAEETP